MRSYVRVPDDLIAEGGQTEIVDVFDVVLRDVDSVHVHQYIADHDHGGVVILPRHVEGVEKVVVQGGEDVGADFVDEMLADDLAQPGVQLLAVFVEDHRVGVSVEFFERETAVVFLLDLLDGVPKERPDVIDVLFVHGHGKRADAHFCVFFTLIHFGPGCSVPRGLVHERVGRGKRPSNLVSWIVSNVLNQLHELFIDCVFRFNFHGKSRGKISGGNPPPF